MSVYIRSMRSRALHHGFLIELGKIILPERKGLNLHTTNIFERMRSGGFFSDDFNIYIPPADIPLKRLEVKTCSVYEVAASATKEQIATLFHRKRFGHRKRQLLATIVLAVEDGIIPLPQEGDTGRMFFPYALMTTVSSGPYTGQKYAECCALVLSPRAGMWEMSDTSNMLALEPGDACCILLK